MVMKCILPVKCLCVKCSVRVSRYCKCGICVCCSMRHTYVPNAYLYVYMIMSEERSVCVQYAGFYFGSCFFCVFFL